MIEAGAIADGEPAAWVAAIVAPIVAAEARVLAEIHHDRGMVRVARAWLSPGGASLARDLPGGWVELRAVAPELLPAALAVAVDAAPRPAPDDRTALTTTESELEAPPEGPLRALLEGRRGSWRITVERPESLESLAVLDGGERGLWVIGRPDQAGRLALTPTDATAVAAMTVGMLSAR